MAVRSESRRAQRWLSPASSGGDRPVGRILRVEESASAVTVPHQDGFQHQYAVKSHFTPLRTVWWLKQLLLLAVMQVACLGIGLGIYQQLLSTGGDSETEIMIAGLALSPVTAAFLWIASAQGTIGFLVLNRVWRTYRREDSLRNLLVEEQQQNLNRTRDAVILGLSGLADTRDCETHGHLDRVGLYAERLAEAALKRPEFSSCRNTELIQRIRISAALHDIGKVGIDDSILQKPGRLTVDERRCMEAHTEIGSECIRQVQEYLGDADFLTLAHEIAAAHHERWDGTGYPAKLAGEAIPLSARIVAIADVYDALSAKRVYKDAYPHERCVNIIVSDAGKHFDPRLVEVFQELQSEFQSIAARFPVTSADADVTQALPLSASGATVRYRLDKPEDRPVGKADRLISTAVINR